MTPVENYKRTRQKLCDNAGIHPESKIATTKGITKNVHYLEIGSGKPLILIHGGGSHASSWINIIKPLAEHLHLYIVDRPGCGLTDAINYRDVDYVQSAVDFVGSFMDAVGVEKAMFAANSMGAYFSINFALQYPQRVEKPDTGLLKAKTISDYKFEVIKDAGHIPWLDQPEKCSELMIKLLQD